MHIHPPPPPSALSYLAPCQLSFKSFLLKYGSVVLGRHTPSSHCLVSDLALYLPTPSLQALTLVGP